MYNSFEAKRKKITIDELNLSDIEMDVSRDFSKVCAAKINASELKKEIVLNIEERLNVSINSQRIINKNEINIYNLENKIDLLQNDIKNMLEMNSNQPIIREIIKTSSGNEQMIVILIVVGALGVGLKYIPTIMENYKSNKEIVELIKDINLKLDYISSTTDSLKDEMRNRNIIDAIRYTLKTYFGR